MVKKTLKCKVLDPTNKKEQLLDKEYSNLQEFLQLKKVLWWKDNLGQELYSANKQQAERYYKKIEQDKKYPISVRKDLIEVKKQDTKLSKYWFRVRIGGVHGGIWVAIRPHQDIPKDVEFCESKITKEDNDYYIHLTFEKEVKIKKSYSSILSIDLGVKWIATVCDISNGKTKFYGKELRRVRGHYFNLRRRLAKKKLQKMIEKIGHKEHKNKESSRRPQKPLILMGGSSLYSFFSSLQNYVICQYNFQ